MATGINVTKVNDYAVIGINQGLNVSKVIEYIVLSDESFFDETPSGIPSIGALGPLGALAQ